MYKLVKKKLKTIGIVQCIYNNTIVIIRNLILFISFFLKVDHRKLLFQSYEGRQFSCNPKYIAEYLRKHDRDFRLIISVKNTKKYAFLKELGYELVKSNSFKYYYHYLTSKVVVFNDFKPAFIPDNHLQIIINTWHGGGAYKKVGLPLSKNIYYSQRYKWMHQVDYMISSCNAFTELAVLTFSVKQALMLPFGMPRNDVFFSNKAAQDHTVKKIKSVYKIDHDKKIVLYAPTYRESLQNSLYGLDFKLLLESLKKKFTGDWIVLFRGHYFLDNNVKQKNGLLIDVSSYDDMQELLCAADILITDYSSSIWDFSFTNKPCFIFATDIESYRKENDFYIPMDEWPFSIATDNKELSGNILQFDQDEYITKVKKHHYDLGSFEDGHATERVVKLINDICSGEMK